MALSPGRLLWYPTLANPYAAPAWTTPLLWTIGVAVLRYRLLDIDLIINRTLVYVSLSAILGGLLAASSAVSQRIFVALTGDTSDIAIVLATLVVAGAFTPIQRAVQGVADRYVKPAGAATADAAPIPPAASAPATAASPPSAAEGAAPAELNVMLRPILARLDRLEGRIAEGEPKRPAPRSPSAPPPGEAT